MWNFFSFTHKNHLYASNKQIVRYQDTMIEPLMKVCSKNKITVHYQNVGADNMTLNQTKR